MMVLSNLVPNLEPLKEFQGFVFGKMVICKKTKLRIEISCLMLSFALSSFHHLTISAKGADRITPSSL